MSDAITTLSVSVNTSDGACTTHRYPLPAREVDEVRLLRFIMFQTQGLASGERSASFENPFTVYNPRHTVRVTLEFQGPQSLRLQDALKDQTGLRQ